MASNWALILYAGTYVIYFFASLSGGLLEENLRNDKDTWVSTEEKG